MPPAALVVALLAVAAPLPDELMNDSTISIHTAIDDEQLPISIELSKHALDALPKKPPVVSARNVNGN